MKSGFLKRIVLLLVTFTVMAPLSLPTFAQGRGNGRGVSKKSTKFVNGHDARDGRFDGRGPRPFPTSGVQVRGNGRGLSKKSTKFVNGHDARAGRFDGKGPKPRTR